MNASSNPIVTADSASANAAMTKFRVVNLSAIGFCVVAYTYPVDGHPCDSCRIKDHPSEKEAKSLCKRLIDQQTIVVRIGRQPKRRAPSLLATRSL
jgi:hypothetical protein